jgi:hypothetical protein
VRALLVDPLDGSPVDVGDEEPGGVRPDIDDSDAHRA